MTTKKWWQLAEDQDGVVAEGNSDDDGNNKNKQKWKSLEHHGVTFYPSYSPHGVKILHKVEHPPILSH